ncbi:hypothetical protein AB3R30_06910 [Leptolyngbyaceae cyanobacterium UHCC 1019]
MIGFSQGLAIALSDLNEVKRSRFVEWGRSLKVCDHVETGRSRFVGGDRSRFAIAMMLEVKQHC